MHRTKSSFLIRNESIPLLKLAIPLILTGVVQSSLGFFENIFLARLGEHILAAGALVTALFTTLIVVSFGIFSSVNILSALKFGANDQLSIVLILRDGLLLALMLTGPSFLLFWNVSDVLFLFKQSPELVELAKLYLQALAWGLLPKFIIIVLYEFLLGLGHSRTIMVITILTIPLYIFFSYAFIFGRFGFPALGIAGAGWGMTLSDWLVVIFMGIFLFANHYYRFFMLSIFTLKKPSFLFEILRLGVPIGLMYCVEVGFFFVITLVMGTINVQTLAAYQVALQYLTPLVGIIFCISQAITVRMGHQLGANEINRAKLTAYVGIFLSIFFMVICAIFYWVIPKTLIAVDFDVNNPDYFLTVHLASKFLFIAAFFQIIESVRFALFGALRALKDTHFMLLVSLFSFWVIGLPFGYSLAIPIGLGGDGLWWGMVIGAGLSVILLYKRFEFRMSRYQLISNSNVE